MKDEDVLRIAEGRIYTGKRAKELGLVDELGGLQDAIAAAWTLAGQSGEPRVQPMPRKRHTVIDLLQGRLPGRGPGDHRGPGAHAQRGRPAAGTGPLRVTEAPGQGKFVARPTN